MIARLLPFGGPPVLILSYPRCGSSWVGAILSESKSSVYLQEPITRPYLKEFGGKFALVDICNDAQANSIYTALADNAFRGIPPGFPSIVKDYKDFIPYQRLKKRILIKEVNPKAAGFFCERYKPKVVLLLRHPAAVALSFFKIGWYRAKDTQLDTGNPYANAWEKFGYAYGSTMKSALEITKRHGECEVVLYEHLVENPHLQFARLFEILQFKVPESYDELIQKYCFSHTKVDKHWQVERMSKEMAFKWRIELSEQQLSLIRKGYLLSNLSYYTDPNEWTR